MFDDPAFFNTWIEDASNHDLAMLYLDWLKDECVFPLDFSLVDECHKRGIALTDLESLTLEST